jgi:hypothetical protein
MNGSAHRLIPSSCVILNPVESLRVHCLQLAELTNYLSEVRHSRTLQAGIQAGSELDPEAFGGNAFKTNLIAEF